MDEALGRGYGSLMTTRPESLNLLRHLASKPGHDEVKSDFRDLLVAEFDVDLSQVVFEQRVEVKSRIDALIGRTVFEAKRDLGHEMRDVEHKMPDYLANREAETGEPFIGMASDGRKWVVFALEGVALVKLKETTLDPDKPSDFLAWLDGALALKASLHPDTQTVRAELGGDSVAFRTAEKALRALWERLKSDKAVHLKRQLWAQLLKIVYGRDIDSDALWLQHTYLVIVAKCIAFAVLGANEDDPARLLSGEKLADSGISGAVESDFFDWIVADREGAQLVRRVMAHVRRFRLAEVESDVLKALYESLIDRDERHGLGEYYTPDWLAAKIVKHVVKTPVRENVLDPACGSGTFLFHAVRVFLAAAEDGDMDPTRMAYEATQHIAGTDIHPVAVIIARITFLLALGPALTRRAGPIFVPVYLGEALHLSISEFIGGKELVVQVPPPPAGDSGPRTDSNGREVLKFPETFCRDPGLFDKAIERMRTGSLIGMTREQIETALVRITEQHYKADITREQQLAIGDLGETYATFDRLRKEGRDSVWAYVARNLSRPLAFASSGGWADAVIGNPPWVAYRHMSADLQKRFKELAKGAGVYVGGKFGTQNDLCGLFVARASRLYLRATGRIAFVLPLSVLTRGQFEKLRKGVYQYGSIGWEEAWTMDDSVQPLFPVPACVVFGRRQRVGKAMPETVRAYSGALPARDASEEIVDRLIVAGTFKAPEDVAKPTATVTIGGSTYRRAFRQGATLVPRMLCFVERVPTGRLGIDITAPPVRSKRTNQEKKPWKDLPGIENQVEAQFLRPILLGESIAPYRILGTFEGVIPEGEDGRIYDAATALNRGYDHLFKWMKKAEAIWNTDRSEGGDMLLNQRWNYHNGLTNQFPTPVVRVLFAASGTVPAACIVTEIETVIEHGLYWARAVSLAEARYLTAILNSETARERVEKYQARGQWGARHFDKVIFNLPIPVYEHKRKVHRDLAAAAERAETVAAAVALPEGVKFQRARSIIRAALVKDGVAGEIDALVAGLLDA